MKRPLSFTVCMGLALNVAIITAIIVNYPNLIAYCPFSFWLCILVPLIIGKMLIIYWCVSTDLAITEHLKKEEEEEKLKLREEIEKSIRKELEEEFRKKTE